MGTEKILVIVLVILLIISIIQAVQIIGLSKKFTSGYAIAKENSTQSSSSTGLQTIPVLPIQRGGC